MMFKIRSKEDIDYLVTGLTFYGTGGGGNPDNGRKILYEIFDSGKELSWIDINETVDHGLAVTPYIMGSAAPEPSYITNLKREIGLLNKIWDFPMVEALKELETQIESPISYIIPLELGGGSTARALALSSLADLDLVDGDYAGRAVPEITQVLPSIYGYEATPIVAADEYGNIVIIKKTINNMVAERFGKLISEISYAQVGFPLDIRIARKLIVPRTLTRSYEVGQLLRSESNIKSCIEKLEKKIGSKLIFKGVLKRIQWETIDYYMVGKSEFDGLEEFEGFNLKIWFKNENHLAFLNGNLIAYSPDLISIIDKDNCSPLTNTRLKIGDQYIVFVTKSDDKLKSKEAQKFIGKEYFMSQYEKYEKLKK